MPNSRNGVRVLPPTAEHHRDPLGIGEGAPRLSWIVDEAPARWSQAAYEVELTDEAGRVRTAGVTSAESVLVDWPFEPLGSGSAVHLRVRVIGEDGSVSPWSGPAAVETGLLAARDWRAVFIAPAASCRTALLRTEFVLADKEIRSARCYASALGVVEAEVNGVRVGELAPAWTEADPRPRYQTHDVTRLLRRGPNALGVWLADGRRPDGAFAALAQIVVTYADGTRDVVASSPAWKAARSPITSAGFPDGEAHDARLEQPGWSSPGFDDTAWGATCAVAHSPGTPAAPESPPARLVLTTPVVEVVTTPSGATVLDFGRELVGRPRIAVRGPAGHTVVLRHAEALVDGELGVVRAVDSYTLRGAGDVERWAPRFTFHRFRYVEVRDWPGEFDPGDVTVEVVHSGLRRTGYFECSDERVNRLHETVVRTVRDAFLLAPSERRVFTPTAAFLYDVAGFLSSRQADPVVERAGGVVPMVAPAAGVTVTWSDPATVVPWVLHHSYGDLAPLERRFPAMAAWVDHVDGLAGPRHLWTSGFACDEFRDPGQARTAPEIIATAYFARSARIVADTACLLGRAADVTRYSRLANAVRVAFADEYVTCSGRLMSDTATAYSLALGFDLLNSPAQRERAAERLARLVADRGSRSSTGSSTGSFAGPLLCDVLSANGHEAEAYRMVADECASDPATAPDQHALGAIADWLHRVVAGLSGAGGGYRALRIAPQPGGGIRHASADLRTPYGHASSAWSIGNGVFSLRVRVPVGSVAEVVLPSGHRIPDVTHGAHEWNEPVDVAGIPARRDEVVLLAGGSPR